MGDPRENGDVTEHPLANYPRPPPRGEDLPYDDGEPMESGRHRAQMNLLIDTLDENRTDPSGFFVGGNMFVYFSETQAKKNDFRGPDVFVVIGRPQQDLKSWVTWEQEGHLPDVVIELLSPKTEKVDRGKKLRIYRDVMKVSRYYLFDPFTMGFEGFALVKGQYLPITPSPEGRLECRPLGLELGVHETLSFHERIPMLRWFDADGRVLPTRREVADATAVRARAEASRADAEASRADAEASRADAEAKRADAEAKRADAERLRVEELERRLAALEGNSPS